MICPDRIKLNVGGRVFETFRDTLTQFPNTLLGRMFSDANTNLIHPDRKGEFFFDRNPDYFAVILDFHRTQSVNRPPHLSLATLKQELDYFCIWEYMTETDLMQFKLNNYGELNCNRGGLVAGNGFGESMPSLYVLSRKDIISNLCYRGLRVFEKALRNHMTCFSITIDPYGGFLNVPDCLKETVEDHQFWIDFSSFFSKSTEFRHEFLQAWSSRFSALSSVDGNFTTVKFAAHLFRVRSVFDDQGVPFPYLEKVSEESREEKLRFFRGWEVEFRLPTKMWSPGPPLSHSLKMFFDF